MKTILLVTNLFLVQSLFSQFDVANYYKDNFIFNSGFWVYEDTLSHAIDSIAIVDFSWGYTFPHPNDPNEHKFYLIDYHSFSYDYSYNDYFVFLNHMKRNGGGVYGQDGQPILFGGNNLGSLPPVGNNFNGCEIIEIMDSMEIMDISYYDVIHVKIHEMEQLQHEFDFDTDLFFAPGVGLIRKQYSDSVGINYVWDLVNWQADNTAVAVPGISKENNIEVYPNPTTENVVVDLGEFKNEVNVTITNSLGQIILSQHYDLVELFSIHINGSAGTYFLHVKTDDDKAKTVSIIKQ